MTLAETTLETGRTVALEQISIRPTYLGLMMGTPDMKTIFVTGGEIDVDEDAFLVLPYPVIEYPHPKDMTFIMTRFPLFLLQGQLTSSPFKEGDYSFLTVAWLVESLPDNPVAAFLEAIKDICWEAKAQDATD